MFRRLRRASRQLSFKERQDAKINITRDTETYPRASLLGLPAEIRNQIYEFVAVNTSLSFSASRSQRAKNIPGLIATCRQTSIEFRPIMLAWAKIDLPVVGYEFDRLVTLINKPANDSDILALRENNRIWVILYLASCCTPDHNRKMSKWLKHCVSKEPYANGLILNYGAGFLSGLRPPRPAHRYTSGFQIRYDVLQSHVRMFRGFARDADGDVEKQELSYIVADLEEEVKNLALLDADRRRNL